MIAAREKALKCVSYIRYLVQFKDTNETQVQALIDSRSKINIIHLSFVKKLSLSIGPVKVGAQKIDVTMLDTYKMVIVAFSIMDKENRIKFFEETFLVANVSPEVVFGIPFLTLSGAEVIFSGQELC